MHPPYLNNGKSGKVSFYDVQDAFKTWADGKDINTIKGIKQYKRWEWFNAPRVYPSGLFPDPAHNYTEWQKYRVYLTSTTEKSIKNNPDWISVSPATIPPSPDELDIHGMGRINCITFHPTDTNTLWIGASQGGAWKTTDGGLSWICLTDNEPVLRVSDIAIDPVNPDIIYLATGDINFIAMNSVSLTYVSKFGVGILKSTDGGATWNPTGLSFEVTQLDQTLLRKIVINSANTSELIAGGSLGIFKSHDAGNTWTQVNNDMIIDMKINPLRDSTIYAASYFSDINNTQAKILKSVDFGSTWTELNSGVPYQNKVVRTELAIAPSDTGIVYALTCGINNGFYALYKTEDAGFTWDTVAARDTIINNPGAAHAPNMLGWTDGGYFEISFLPADEGGQGHYDLTIVVDPNDADRIYTGGVNMWGSYNGGQTWNFASMWQAYFGPSIHADQHYSVFHPLTGDLYQAHDGGIDKTSSISLGNIDTVLNCVNLITQEIYPDCYDLPTDWTNITHGLHITEYYRLAVCKTNPVIIVAGCQDNGTYMYNNGIWLNILGGDGMEAMIDYTNPEIIYATNYNGLLSKSTDGGQSFQSGLEEDITSSGETGDWITPFVMHPFNPDVIYAGFNNVWRSDNAGSSWTRISNFQSSLNIIALAVAGSDQNYIYAARLNDLYMTNNGGQTWHSVEIGLPVDVACITAIAVSESNPEELWVAFSGYQNGNKVYKSSDAGDNWTNISGDLPNYPVNCIVYQEATINGVSNALYIGTDIGVFYTNDSIQNLSGQWLYYSEGLPKVIINELEINYISQELFAATYGRGLWRANLYSPSDITGETAVNNRINLEITPNPNKGRFTITARTPGKTGIKVGVFSMSGDKVKSFIDETCGSYIKEVDIRALPPGSYLVRVEMENSIFTKLVIKM